MIDRTRLRLGGDHRAWLGLAGLVVAAVGIGIGIAIQETGGSSKTSSIGRTKAAMPSYDAKVAEATLYCDFYNILHSATVVSFYFTVDKQKAGLRFVEQYVVEADTSRTVLDDTDPNRIWSFHVEDDAPLIISGDGETQIKLYGLRLHDSNVVWVESGVRSNVYKNLGGRCRQAQFGRLADL